MNHDHTFSVSRFKDRNGVFSFRVDAAWRGSKISQQKKSPHGF